MSKDKIDKLIRQLIISDDDVQRNAVDALVAIGKPAVPRLIDVWRIDIDGVVSSQAAAALVDIGKPAVPYLVDALKDKHSTVRGCAAVALGRIGEPAVPALVDTLKDEDDNVRWSAAGALIEIIHSLTDIRLREMGGLLRKALEKTEGREEKESLVDLLEEINERRNEIFEPEAKKLKPPKRIKRKPKRKIWRAVQ